MSQILLSESHPETGPLNGRIVLHQRLQLLMIKQIRIPFANMGISQHFMNLQRTGLHPAPVFPVTAMLRNLANIDFRIEISSKCHPMVSGITIHNIQIMNLIKIMFGCISCKNSRYTRVKPASQNSSQPFFLKTVMVSPLPAIFKMCLILRFIIGRIQIIHPTLQTGLHNSQVLVRQCHINHNLRPERTHQLY